MRRSIHLAVAVVVLATSSACDANAPDGAGVVIETLADQPSSTELGVALAIHARGGASVEISVEQGAFVTPGAEPFGVPAGRQSDCFASAGATPFTLELSVRPVNDEALLFVSLFAEPDCMGARIQSRIVAVHPPPANPAPVDAAAGVQP